MSGGHNTMSGGTLYYIVECPPGHSTTGDTILYYTGSDFFGTTTETSETIAGNFAEREKIPPGPDKPYKAIYNREVSLRGEGDTCTQDYYYFEDICVG